MTKFERLVILLKECIEDAYKKGRMDAIASIREAVGDPLRVGMRIKKGGAEEAIRSALLGADGPLSPSEIATVTNYSGSNSGLRATLQRMQAQGTAKKLGRGKWELAA